MLRSTSAVEECKPTQGFETQLKNECPDKTLLNDINSGWTKHEVGHSIMGECECGETKEVKSKNLAKSTR